MGMRGGIEVGGKASANGVKWVGEKMEKEVISYNALGVAYFRALSSFTD